MSKHYLGDAVYVDFNYDTHMIILTTEDGIHDTNRIFLDPLVWHALVNYLKHLAPPPPLEVQQDHAQQGQGDQP